MRSGRMRKHPTATCHNAPPGRVMTENKLPKNTERHDSRVRCISPHIGANTMSAKSTRRTILAGAATLPVLSVPALAIDHPDAELLRLGEQLAVLEREWEERSLGDRECLEAFHAACERAGLPDRNHDEFENFDQFAEYNKKRSALMPHGPDDFEDENGEIGWGRFNNRLYDLVDEIMSLKATTLAGLAVQTRAMVAAEFELWELDPEKSDYTDQLRREFLELTCSFLGIEPARIRLARNV
jgi:hypothetical protein